MSSLKCSFLGLRIAINGSSHHAYISRQTAMLLGKERFKLWLDVGCGDGIQTAEVAKIVNHDLCVALDMAKRHIPKRFRIVADSIVADALHMPFRDRSFSLITCYSLVEHLRDRELFLKEVKRTLKRRGQFIAYFPNRLFPLEFHTGMPFLSIAPRWFAEVFAKTLLHWPTYAVWPLTKKEFWRLCASHFESVVINNANFEEDVIPTSFLRYLYRTTKKFGVLRIFPIGYVFKCRVS